MLPSILAVATLALRPSVHAVHSSCRAAIGRTPLVFMQARILTEENAVAVLDECMADLGTMFGTNADSARVGITGVVEFVELDGPTVVVRLKGRFWHERVRVVERVSSYVLERIPECVDVVIEDAEQLDDADPDELEAVLDATFNDPPVQFGNG